MFTINPLLRTDSYKLSHREMYPEGTSRIYSNYTSRGSRIPGVAHTVHFGLQAYLTDLTEGFDAFFKAPKEEVLEEYREITSSFVTPRFTLDHIAALHDLGYLPLRFASVPEGTLVPIRVPSLSVENTHPDFFWLTNYIESDLSASLWHPSTTATQAWNLRRLVDQAAERSSDSPEATDFALHDFSYRGHTNWLAAAASGAGHLLSSKGTDTVTAVPWVKHYYPGDNGLIGASVPATEHSVMCAGGKENELETIRRLLQLFPEGILSIVMDTWDFFHVLTDTLPALKDEIMARNGKLVVRPDSGDPVDIITGSVPANRILGEGTPEQKGAIELLFETFGGTVNSKGYIELDPHVGLIYGDSINRDRLVTINARLMSKGFASTNWVAGMGSFTYQYVTRDTFGSAVKATEVVINDVPQNIFKDPKTDNGLKRSATGRLAVLADTAGNLSLVQQATPDQEAQSVIQPVWEDGKFLRTQSFADVRETLRQNTEVLIDNGTLN